MAVLAGRQVELGQDAPDVLLDGALRDDEPGGDTGVREALGHETEHLSLPWRQLGEWVVAAAPREKLAHERGIDHGPSASDPLECFEEVVDSQHRALQQVPDSL